MGERRESRIEKMITRSMEVSAWVTSVLIFMMMSLIVWDVFQRYLLGAASQWISDFVTLYLIIYVTFLPAGWLLMKGEHVAVEIVVSKLGQKKRHRMTLLSNILGLFYSMVLTWQGWLFMWHELTKGNTFPTTVWLPVSAAVGVIFIGGILLCLAFLMKIVTLLHKHNASNGERLDSF